MKKIQLANNRGVALISDKHFGVVSKHEWAIMQGKHTSYAQAHINRNGKRTTIQMHRLIMGEPKGMQVDHIDGNGLNNQISNLRTCTQSQNSMNQHSVRGLSQYKGVHWLKKNRKWRALIMKNGKRTHLGCRDSETEAAKLYDTAAKKLFGEFAKLNFQN